MAKQDSSFFVDDAAVSALAARVPSALVNSGCFGGGSNSPGIGISTLTKGLEDSLPSWTLLDQHGNPRNAQIGQLIGGSGISEPSTSTGTEGTAPDATIRLMPEANMPTAEEKADGTKLDGELSLPADGASLIDLAAGWAAQV